MGVVELPDAVQSMIDREVAEGRAASAAAFVEEAILRLVDSANLEEAEVAAVAAAGSADIQAGQYRTIATQEDEEALRARLMSKLQSNLGARP
jgi:Arc/MetJ-type ribon-helix-helix transcriptional regulator